MTSIQYGHVRPVIASPLQHTARGTRISMSRTLTEPDRKRLYWRLPPMSLWKTGPRMAVTSHTSKDKKVRKTSGLYLYSGIRSHFQWYKDLFTKMNLSFLMTESGWPILPMSQLECFKCSSRHFQQERKNFSFRRMVVDSRVGGRTAKSVFFGHPITGSWPSISSSERELRPGSPICFLQVLTPPFPEIPCAISGP